MTDARRALVLSYSVIESDPRVRRQVDWLTGAGWTVDTVGLGGHPTTSVRDHFALGEPSRWVTNKWGIVATHLLLSARRRYRLQVVRRMPDAVVERISAGHYDLLVFNETEFTPLVSDPRVYSSAAARARVHVDLHEYHNPEMRRRTLGGRLTARHYRWVRRHIGHPSITSRSVVNEPIGRLYADEFGVPRLTPVRNAPSRVDQRPSTTRSDEIRLLFHGQAAAQRGFEEILEAMRTLPDRFRMTFMLTPNRAFIAALQDEIDAHPARERIRIVPPVPMREIAERINEYDLEIILFPPVRPNLEFALPNKFFEAVQGRLGIVVGPSPAMADIVREHGIGVVLDGFAASDLAAGLADLTAEDVVRFKAASDAAAAQLNADVEGAVFLRALGAERAL